MIQSCTAIASALLSYADGPVRLITPPEPPSTGAYSAFGVGAYVLCGVFLSAAVVSLWFWRELQRVSGDPSDRALAGAARMLGLSSGQRATLARLAGHLGNGVSPAALVVSRFALRRAVAIELDHKPEPKAVRELQRLVELLVGDISGEDAPRIATTPGTTPPAAKRRREPR